MFSNGGGSALELLQPISVSVLFLPCSFLGLLGMLMEINYSGYGFGFMVYKCLQLHFAIELKNEK